MAEPILKEEDFPAFTSGFTEKTLAGMINKIRTNRVMSPGKNREAFMTVMKGLGYSQARDKLGIEVWKKGSVTVEAGGVPPELANSGLGSWDDALRALREGRLK